MRRQGPAVFAMLLLASVCAATPQSGQINPRELPPPPPPETSPAPVAKPVEIFPLPLNREAVPPPLPDFVVIPEGTRLAVVLDTPLSTRITKTGDPVSFRTSEPVQVHDLLTLPPETEFTGRVVEARRPGGFGKQGVMRVRVERIQLASGASVPVVARLDGQDLDGKGRISTDSNRTADLYSLVVWSAQGALLGSQVKGGKGAAIGAGVGAAIAVIIQMTHRGPDLYLEPGMPFDIVLDQPVELPALDVYHAQQTYAAARAPAAAKSTAASSEIARDPDNATLDKDRPALKRRPRK